MISGKLNAPGHTYTEYSVVKKTTSAEAELRLLCMVELSTDEVRQLIDELLVVFDIPKLPRVVFTRGTRGGGSFAPYFWTITLSQKSSAHDVVHEVAHLVEEYDSIRTTGQLMPRKEGSKHHGREFVRRLDKVARAAMPLIHVTPAEAEISPEQLQRREAAIAANRQRQIARRKQRQQQLAKARNGNDIMSFFNFK